MGLEAHLRYQSPAQAQASDDGDDDLLAQEGLEGLLGFDSEEVSQDVADSQGGRHRTAQKVAVQEVWEDIEELEWLLVDSTEL
jgi:hypothetical protein